jgi:hypothetical protein
VREDAERERCRNNAGSCDEHKKIPGIEKLREKDPQMNAKLFGANDGNQVEAGAT